MRRREVFDLKGFRVGLLGEDDCADIDALYDRCADFIRLSEGRDPVPGDGRMLLIERPEAAPDVEKLVMGLYDGPCLIGVLDLLKDYPSEGIWYLGLMLIEPARRRDGLGSALFEALGGWVAGQGGQVMRLAVIEQNAAGPRFWTRQGFHQVGTVEQDLGYFRRTLHRMERSLI